MNVRWYGHDAVAGTRAIAERLGLGDALITSTYTRHHHEQLEGSKLEVRSAILQGGRYLRLYHELRNSADGDLAATFVHGLGHSPVEAPGIELPTHGTPRSLSLDVDGLAGAPPLEQVRDLDLAVRLERELTTDDSMGADVVPPWLINNLIWGGERPEPEEPWIRELPNGERMAFATMESRLWIGSLPPVGTRVQSFGAVVGLHDKITHEINWAYDTTTAEPLAVFETINLVFNLDQRRAIPIPPEARSREERSFHPDFAPA